MDDETLAMTAAQGDQNAFGILFEKYKRYVYTIAWKITLNEEDALDATQTVFLRLLEKIGSFQARSSFRSWLAALTANETVNLLRSSKRNRTISMDPRDISQVADTGSRCSAADPRNILDTKQKCSLVEKSMSILTPQQRAILTLRMKEDMQPKQIAEYLGLPSSQVRSQLCWAISRIRKTLHQDMDVHLPISKER